MSPVPDQPSRRATGSVGSKARVTGIGVVAPGGIGVRPFWDFITRGRSATRTVSRFDASRFRCRIAAECDFDPAQWGHSPQDIRRMDRAAQFAVTASREAMADAGLTAADLDPERTAVVIGNAVGNTESMEQEYVVISDGGRQWLCDERYALPHLYNSMIPSSMTQEVAMLWGAEGPSTVISTGCTSGLDAIGYASQLIEEGAADLIIAGATDAPISPITMACFDALHATSTRNDDPEHACRPFSGDRDGLVLGEGAAVLILESERHAARRGARVYCTVAGYGSRANAHHMTGLKPDGRELAEAIRVAMRRADVRPEQLGYINAHGSGTPQNDRHETAALKNSLGSAVHSLPVSSIKSMIGHSLGAIGAIELVASVLSINHNLIPPTANYTVSDPHCDLDYVPNEAREQPVDVVLSTGSGFGGFQAAVVLASEEVAAA